MSDIAERLALIRRREPELHACTQVLDDAVDVVVADGLPLSGVAVVVKDNMDVVGTVRTDGLAPPHPPVASRDALAVGRLRAAGAVVVAKANLEELSFGATTQNASWGACRNPWDVARLPGGSSGGCAVAVAAGYAGVALGTDTGGSLRNPAAFCGVAALRPTHGLVPVDGITPLAPRFDVCGPMARTAAELRGVLAVLAGWPAPADAGRREVLDGLRVGVPDAFFFDDLHADVAAGVDGFLDGLAAPGVRVVPLTLEGAADTPAIIAPLLNGTAAHELRAYWEDPRVGASVRERIDLGRAVTPEQTARAEAAAGRWCATVEGAWERVDLILTPTVPFPAPRADDGTNMVAVSRAINRANSAWSLTGGPSLTLPVLRAGALPVGVQLTAARGRDAWLLDVGAALEASGQRH